MKPKVLLDELIELYKKYSAVYRRTISFDKYKNFQERGYGEQANIACDDVVIRETLLEHVGNLPIIAIFLYPHLEHKGDIDLGRVLTMLAMHDIGETVVGDAHPYHKSAEFRASELQATLSLISKDLHDLYQEYEARETLDAKFAKAVDVFSTFLSDQLIPPALVKARLKTHGFTWLNIEERRYEIFAWDNTLKDLFTEVATRYQKIETIRD